MGKSVNMHYLDNLWQIWKIIGVKFLDALDFLILLFFRYLME